MIGSLTPELFAAMRAELGLDGGADLAVMPEGKEVAVTIDGRGLTPEQWRRLEQAGLVRAEPQPFPPVVEDRGQPAQRGAA